MHIILPFLFDMENTIYRPDLYKGRACNDLILQTYTIMTQVKDNLSYRTAPFYYRNLKHKMLSLIESDCIKAPSKQFPPPPPKQSSLWNVTPFCHYRVRP